MYQSPIEIITKQMRTQFEDNVFKAIQDYGIVVDKEELIKALQYDRGQYEKGYSDGMLAQKSEWISVDERLPEDKQMCLAYGTVYYVPDEHSKEIMVTKFYEEFGFIEQIHAHITHWMPLPEAPKMKGGAE